MAYLHGPWWLRGILLVLMSHILVWVISIVMFIKPVWLDVCVNIFLFVFFNKFVLSFVMFQRKYLYYVWFCNLAITVNKRTIQYNAQRPVLSPYSRERDSLHGHWKTWLCFRRLCCCVPACQSSRYQEQPAIHPDLMGAPRDGVSTLR